MAADQDGMTSSSENFCFFPTMSGILAPSTRTIKCLQGLPARRAFQNSSFASTSSSRMWNMYHAGFLWGSHTSWIRTNTLRIPCHTSIPFNSSRTRLWRNYFDTSTANLTGVRRKGSTRHLPWSIVSISTSISNPCSFKDIYSLVDPNKTGDRCVKLLPKD